MNRLASRADAAPHRAVSAPPLEHVDRYVVSAAFASGGMATVHLGKLAGGGGFSRVVAIKRMLPGREQNPAEVAILRDEARVTSRVQHPNVVPVLDVIDAPSGLALVMEYVHGLSLATLCRAARAAGRPIPGAVAATVIVHVLRGLHAAHEARDESGAPLDLVHRDVSPANVLVGADGHARLIDFGVAKAAGKEYVTRTGVVRGKIAYMAPELLRGEPATRGTDVFATGLVLLEMLTGDGLFAGASEAEIITRLVTGDLPALEACAPDVPRGLRRVVERAIDVDVGARFQTAEEMERELAGAVEPAPPSTVARWVEDLGYDELAVRAALVRDLEHARVSPPAPAPSTSVALHGERRRRTITLASWIGAGAILVVATAIAGVALGGRAAEADAPSSAPPSATAAPATLPSDSAAAVPAGTVAPTDAPSPSARPVDGARPAASTSLPRHRAPSGKPRRGCDPPYTIDHLGQKHYISSCL